MNTDSGHTVEVGDVWNYDNVANDKYGTFLVLGFTTIELNEEPTKVVIVWHLDTRQKTWLAFRDKARHYILISRLS